MKETLSAMPAGLLTRTAAAQVHVEAVPGRLSLRAQGDLSPLRSALGVSLPSSIGQRAKNTALEIVCLGPDEWLIVADNPAPIIDGCRQVYKTTPHSLVDLSGREVTFKITGPRATEIVTLGCPRNPETINSNEARRTVFDGASVVLWHDSHDGGDVWRMDVWNSFADHVYHLLEIGCRELAAEIE